MPAEQDPLDVGVRGRVQCRHRVPRTRQDPRRHAPLDVAKEAGVATQPAHDRAREEDPEQEPPSPGIPLLVVKGFPRLLAAALKEPSDTRARMDQGEDIGPEAREIALKLPGPTDPPRDLASVSVPEPPSVGR